MKGFTFVLALAIIACAHGKSIDEYRKSMKASFEKCQGEFGKSPELDLPIPPSIPHQVKCMFNCMLEEMGVIQKDNVDGTKFADLMIKAGYLDAEREEKFRSMTKECGSILNSDRCIRGSEIFHCLKSAAESMGIKCDDE